jgi:hypothetical protein
MKAPSVGFGVNYTKESYPMRMRLIIDDLLVYCKL